MNNNGSFGMGQQDSGCFCSYGPAAAEKRDMYGCVSGGAVCTYVCMCRVGED
jgi:hypothetical protein